jgi:putative phosphoribosyl transferase
VNEKLLYEIAETPVKIRAGETVIDGNLSIAENAIGIVLFAHGTGSGRFSPRNKFVAEVLHQHKLSTLLIDLLTASEESEDMQTGHLRFNIPFLAQRLMAATDWVKDNSETRNLNPGYFGASTGAAAALMAAVEEGSIVKAIVSRGGRPDLASDVLPEVQAPTLLIVGGYDLPVIEMNRQAFRELKAEKKMVIIPDATHLFEEPGALEEVARSAVEWFSLHLGGEAGRVK